MLHDRLLADAAYGLYTWCLVPFERVVNMGLNKYISTTFGSPVGDREELLKRLLAMVSSKFKEISYSLLSFFQQR